MTSQCTQNSSLPNELWVRSFSYLDQNDLFNLGTVSRNFLSMSSADSIWESHCRRRWEGKQNTGRFMKKGEGGENDGRVEYSALNMGSLMHEPKSWKEAYIMAEIDSRRPLMSREELVYFKWQLIYDGSPSQMGLRKFEEDNTYFSPYMGPTEWLLNGSYLMFAGMSLLVEKNSNNWGWVIGRDQRTMYLSVEEDRT